MLSKKRPSRQDILRRQQRSTFVGRIEQLEAFEHNLIHLNQDEDGFVYPYSFLFNTWGQGGVGKTTLLRRFEDITKQHKGVAALVDEAIGTVPAVMAEFARQLKEQGHHFAKFDERYKVFRQKQNELETDPEAPKGFSALMGKTVAKAGLSLGKQVPGVEAAIDLLDQEAIADGAGEWTAYVSRKLKNKDEIQLVNEPVKVLTPLFLEDLGKIAEHQVVLLFDTYERTSKILDQWLLDTLAERYGGVPLNCILVIAGREQLNPNRWSGYEPIPFPVNPFTKDEATQFLQRKGITNPDVIEKILDISERLPLLLATLAENASNDPADIGEASGTAVERFLKWVDDPVKRSLALAAALPQVLDKDVVACLSGKEHKEELFIWLKGMPFVRERSDGWAYHDVVRPQMLRYQRRESTDEWEEKHQILAEYYSARCQQLGLEETVQWTDSDWQRNALAQLHHQLCSRSTKALAVALNQLLDALEQSRDFAQSWASTISQTGQDLDDDALRHWGESLTEGLKAYKDSSNFSKAIFAFTALLKFDDIKKSKSSIIYAWRGEAYRQVSKYKEAVSDFGKAINLSPEYKWAIKRRGKTYAAMKRYEDALLDYDRAVAIDPKDWTTFLEKGTVYLSVGRVEDAILGCTKCIELEPDLSMGFALRGLLSQSNQQPRQAISDFTRAIEITPELKETLIVSRGTTYREINCYEEAIEDFTEAVTLKPEDKSIFVERGETYQLAKCYEKAIEDFTQSINLDPEYKEALCNRGEVYRVVGQYGEAIEDFTKSINLEPEDASYPLLARGLTYLLSQRYTLALQDLTETLKIDQNSPGYCCRALAHICLKNNEAAKADLSQAVSIAKNDYQENPKRYRNTFNLGLYHLIARKVDIAKQYYQEAITTGAPIATIHDVADDLRMLLIIIPNHPYVREVEGMLELAIKMNEIKQDRYP